MSSVANPHNNFASAHISESDNDDENDYDSSFNRQYETTMHKVKDVVSKFLHPSFLFSASNETDRPKRKRSTSVEEKDVEQQSDTTTTTTKNGRTTTAKSKSNRRLISDDEPQVTDDEDNNSQDVPTTEQDISEIEQQKKRRRTANYQNILSTKTANSNYEGERTFSPSTSVDSVRSSSNRRIVQTSITKSVPLRTTIEQNRNEGIDRFTSSKQRFNILSTYRGSTSNYDPSQSSLFSVGSRKTTETTMSPNRTTRNLTSNEFSANHLLATSLVTRSQSSTSNNQQSLATLSNPTTTNNNRLLSNERQMLGVNYASIHSRRLPYIERLRRRTLQDCIRLNRTLDSEPLSMSTIEEHRSVTASPVLKRTKAPEKECGIQCDISTVDIPMEPNKKNQRTFPPSDIRDEALAVPTTEKIQSFSQVDLTIPIEKIRPTPIIVITKPKVLGNIAPFSWPEFARAQEEYAKKYPEKCHADAVPTKSVIEKSNVNIFPTVLQQTNGSSTISKVPIFPSSSLRPAKPTSEAIWKCPSCTKEHPAQTASCSLCHCINPNCKRLGAIQPTVTIEKEPVSQTPPSKLPDFISKEPSVSKPVTTTNQTVTTSTTKENVLSISPAVTTSAPSTTFPPFTPFPATNQTNPVSTSTPFTSSTSSLFSVAPSVSSSSTTKENVLSVSPAVTTSAPSSTFPPFTPFPATTQANSVSTSAPFTSTTSLVFGAAPIASVPSTTKENVLPIPPSVTTSAPSSTFPSFGSAPFISFPSTTKENPVTTIPSFGSIAAPLFGTIPVDKSSTSSASNLFQVGTTNLSFGLPSSTSFTTAATSSTVSSSIKMTPSILTSTPQVSRSVTFGNTPITTVTSVAPIILSDTTFSPVTSASTPSLTAITSVNPSVFMSSTLPSTSAASTLFPVSSTTSVFPIQSSFTPIPTTSTSVPLFGISGLSAPGFSFSPATTTTTSSNQPFGFGAFSPLRPSVPNTISSAHSNSLPKFGSVPPFGSSHAPSIFGVAATPNLTTNTSETPATSIGGFSFRPPTSTAPVFGVPSSTLPSGGLSFPFNFGATPVVPTNNTPFQFQGSASMPTNNSLFQSTAPSDSTTDSNPYDISNEESAAPARPVLRGKRRLKP